MSETVYIPASVSIHGGTVKIATPKIVLRLHFINHEYIDVLLTDLVRGEQFSFIVLSWPNSLEKLEEFIKNGISDGDYELLKYISAFKTYVTQSKYFENLARGKLTLEQILRAQKQSSSAKFTLEKARAAKQYILSQFKVVCREEDGSILYYKKGEFEFVLHNDVYYYDGQSPCCYAVITELGAKHLDANRFTNYAIYKFINGDQRLLKKWLEKTEDRNFTGIIHALNKSTDIRDKELYDYIKTILALHQI